MKILWKEIVLIVCPHFHSDALEMRVNKFNLFKPSAAWLLQ